jgi:hypothetical protein
VLRGLILTAVLLSAGPATGDRGDFWIGYNLLSYRFGLNINYFVTDQLSIDLTLGGFNELLLWEIGARYRLSDKEFSNCIRLGYGAYRSSIQAEDRPSEEESPASGREVGVWHSEPSWVAAGVDHEFEWGDRRLGAGGVLMRPLTKSKKPPILPVIPLPDIGIRSFKRE